MKRLAAIGPVLALLAAAPAPPRVAVTGGTVEGRATTGALVFQGIPYAAPPLGPLRWTAPQPVRPWRGVRAATAMAAACPQNDAGWNRADAVRGSEDCLTLDVRTPALSGRRPVMVWIHGGSNRAGSAGGTVESRITDRGVVLVAVQYRLGLLGFLAPRGAAVDGTAGNYGLQDQLAALRWVRANIARFGGDPDNVTLFGESAGSQDVSLMLAAPAARGLFAKAILESGTPGFGQPFRSLRQAMALGDQAERLAGVRGVAGLRRLPLARLLAVDRQLRDPALHADDFLWLKTTVDGRVLPASPRILLQRAPARPVIVGSNRAEFGPSDGSVDIPEMLARTYGPNALRAGALYRFGAADHDPRLGHPALEIMTDWVFRCPAGTLATLLARRGWPVWRYEFDLPRPGATLTDHAAEIGYVMDARAVAPGVSLQDYWVNLARGGDPNGAGLPRWPRFDAARRHLAIGPAGVSTGTDLRGAICALRDEL